MESPPEYLEEAVLFTLNLTVTWRKHMTLADFFFGEVRMFEEVLLLLLLFVVVVVVVAGSGRGCDGKTLNIFSY